MTLPSMGRGYVDTPAGQVHFYRSAGFESASSVWICLPPVPYGGAFFATLARALPQEHGIIALDPPGYGASDPIKKLTVADNAQAGLWILDALSITPRGWLGFHSGTLAVIAAACVRPESVRQLLLIDAPAFTPKARADLLAKTVPTRELTHEFDCLEPLWQFNIARHGDALPLERGLSQLVQDLQAGMNQPQGFRAAFSYDIEQAAAELRGVKLKLIATASRLLEPTRYLRSLLEQNTSIDCDYQEWPDVKALVFDTHVQQVADLMQRS